VESNKHTCVLVYCTFKRERDTHTHTHKHTQMATTWGEVLAGLVFFANSCRVQFFAARLLFSRKFVSPLPNLCIFVRASRGSPFEFAPLIACRVIISTSRPASIRSVPRCPSSSALLTVMDRNYLLTCTKPPCCLLSGMSLCGDFPSLACGRCIIPSPSAWFSGH